ncbi:Gp19/Gp15/Gp42 family protein [Nocardia caishijiensis]|uniref:Gp19/Gp15/Gp42-like protein n=1 Tax=Nocardia caishijiensis TaxID=184756 RepID=A0ABQ6YE53_9NOCA|nr:Gp19/Gp15/Gp42 family protein [Nocardia caishijiensis]KAF0835684.1 Gp19/Gp15/Gp42-like protein [Nocardia caishijiensis]
MAYATPSDVQTRLGRALTPDETTLVTTRLADAERMILRRVPDLADKIAAGTVDTADVVQIEADAVTRVVRNPEGIQSETDGNYTYMRGRESASGRLEITRDEWQTLGVRFGMAQMVPNLPGGYTSGGSSFGMGG